MRDVCLKVNLVDAAGEVAEVTAYCNSRPSLQTKCTRDTLMMFTTNEISLILSVRFILKYI